MTLSVKGEAQPLFRFSTTLEPPPEVQVDRLRLAGERRPAEVVFTQLKDASFDAFASKLAAAFGLPGAASRVLAAQSGKDPR